MTLVLLGLGKKSTRSTTPDSWMDLVCKIHEDGRYCCLVVQPRFEGGEILKKPPLCLSNNLQKMEGESKVGLRSAINGLASW